MYVKGAPDRLMPLCKTQVTGTGDASQVAPLDPGFWQQAQAGLSSKGLRVLALCRYVLGLQAEPDWLSVDQRCCTVL